MTQAIPTLTLHNSRSCPCCTKKNPDEAARHNRDGATRCLIDDEGNPHIHFLIGERDHDNIVQLASDLYDMDMFPHSDEATEGDLHALCRAYAVASMMMVDSNKNNQAEHAVQLQYYELNEREQCLSGHINTKRFSDAILIAMNRHAPQWAKDTMPQTVYAVRWAKLTGQTPDAPVQHKHHRSPKRNRLNRGKRRKK